MQTALPEASTPQQISYNLMELPCCKFTSVGLEIDNDIEFETWERIGRCLETAARGVQWWIGDWLNYGEKRYGEKYTQAISETGLDKPTLMNYASVAKRVESSRRREVVDYSKHVEVAGLKPEQQARVLEQAEKEGLTVKEVRRVANRIKRDEGKEKSEIETLHTPEAQEFLTRYIETLKQFEESVPLTARFLRQMFQAHAAQAHWQKTRNVLDDCAVIKMAISESEGSIAEDDLYQWLQVRGYFMSDPEFEARLDYMESDDVKMAKRTDAGHGKQEERRGKLPVIVTHWFNDFKHLKIAQSDEED